MVWVFSWAPIVSEDLYPTGPTDWEGRKAEDARALVAMVKEAELGMQKFLDGDPEDLHPFEGFLPR